MKLSEAFFIYRRDKIQCGGGSLKTFENARCAESVAIRFFGDINIKKIDQEQVSAFYLDLITKEKPVTKNTARNYVLFLRSVIKYHHKKGLKTVNPESIEIPKREKKSANYIDLEQYTKLLEVVSTPQRGYAKINRLRNEVIVKMLFYTGLRISELCSLNRDSIRNREFIIVGKSKNPRPCFITKELESDINEYLSMRQDNNVALFIANETTERITPGTVQRVFRLATKKAHLSKVTPHTMRHSFATRLLGEGVDIRYVADLLGHQNLNTTEQYTHVKNVTLKKIYENVLESY